MKLWKSLRKGIKSNHDGSTWAIGEWRTVSPPTEGCKGLNCSERIIDAISYVSCEVIALVEVDGKIIKGNDKWTCERMRIVRAWEWDKKDSVALSIFAAEMVICNFESLYPTDDRPRKAIEAAKNYLNDPSEENRSAAESARSAAWSAWSAAESAAKSAARSARSAAWSARSAAWSAWSAAESAAKSAARSARSAAWSSAESAESAALDSIEEWLIKRVETLKKIIRSDEDATIK